MFFCAFFFYFLLSKMTCDLISNFESHDFCVFSNFVICMTFVFFLILPHSCLGYRQLGLPSAVIMRDRSKEVEIQKVLQVCQD